MDAEEERNSVMHLGTFLFTMFFGEKVGEDEFGNRYYRSRRHKHHNREQRWVVYRGLAEGSKVPAEWHAWLHHTVEQPLTGESAGTRWDWQKPHLPNLTGTAHAYRPQGHDLQGGHRAAATGDYEAWKPE